MAPAAATAQWLAGQPAAIEREQMEMIAEGAVGVIEAEDPVVELGAEPAERLVGALPAASTSRALRFSSAGSSSTRSSSVARNSPVETSTWATPARVPLRQTAAR